MASYAVPCLHTLINADESKTKATLKTYNSLSVIGSIIFLNLHALPAQLLMSISREKSDWNVKIKSDPGLERMFRSFEVGP